MGCPGTKHPKLQLQLQSYIKHLFNFTLILPKVNTDYIRQAQVMNTDNLRLMKLFKKKLLILMILSV